MPQSTDRKQERPQYKDESKQDADERYTSLRGQYDKLDEDYQKDKAFYEEALEARMN